MSVIPIRSEASSRGARMLRTALGGEIVRWLAEPAVIEVMLNPDGRLWIDRLGVGLTATGGLMTAADGERIIRLVAHHVGAEVHCGAPRVSAELPDGGERFEGLLPPVVAAPILVDPSGLLPVYVVDTASHTLLTSHVRLIARCCDTRLGVDWTELHSFLCRPDLRQRATCVEGVYELRPGSLTVIGAGSCQDKQLWCADAFMPAAIQPPWPELVGGAGLIFFCHCRNVVGAGEAEHRKPSGGERLDRHFVARAAAQEAMADILHNDQGMPLTGAMIGR